MTLPPILETLLAPGVIGGAVAWLARELRQREQERVAREAAAAVAAEARRREEAEAAAKREKEREGLLRELVTALTRAEHTIERSNELLERLEPPEPKRQRGRT